MPPRITPPAETRRLSKSDLLETLQLIDSDPDAVERVLRMEAGFRDKIDTQLSNLPVNEARFEKLKTNPFVLLAWARRQGYTQAAELDTDVVLGKVWSSMETSLGKLIEQVVLPVYDWQLVPSTMQSEYSVIDGLKWFGETVHLITLKSGPVCLNDSMVQGMSEDVARNLPFWARDRDTHSIEFVVGVLYGTEKKSNKKDFHVINWTRKKLEALGASVEESTERKWHGRLTYERIDLGLRVRIGTDLWNYVGDRSSAFVEICTAMIRACVAAGAPTPSDFKSVIEGFDGLISTHSVPSDYNVSVLQRGQLEWLFLTAAGFCDELTD